MSMDQNVEDYKRIVKGHARDELRKRIRSGEMPGVVNGKRVTIRHAQIQDRKIIHDPSPRDQGTGQGEGKPGDQIGQGQKEPGEGEGEASDQTGEHEIEVDWELDELRDILTEELGVPTFILSDEGQMSEEDHKYTKICRQGPAGLRHKKKSFLNALKREKQEGSWIAGKAPKFIRNDFRYKGRRVILKPRSRGVIFYKMDISGSMGFEQKEIARTFCFYIDTVLSFFYKDLEKVYIVHDAQARLVDEHTFFNLRESGGTKISSAYDLEKKVCEEKYSDPSWNKLGYHFTDGDNWGGGDTELCVELLKDFFIPNYRQIGSIQVKSSYGSGQFNKDLISAFGINYDGTSGGTVIHKENLCLAFTNDKSEISQCIKGLFDPREVL